MGSSQPLALGVTEVEVEDVEEMLFRAEAERRARTMTAVGGGSGGWWWLAFVGGGWLRLVMVVMSELHP